MEEDGAPTAGKIIAISDMHFGDETQLLNDRQLADRFTEVLSGRGPVEELVLLGDLLDLWVKTLVPAIREGRRFIEGIAGLDNVKKIVYVPGNHDHQVFMDAFREEVEARVMRGDLTTPKFMPARSYEGAIISGLARPGSDVSFSLVYPFITRLVAGREVVFTHGHHLDFYDPSFGWARTFWLSRRIIKKRRQQATLHDIEMANLPFCGAMSVAPWVPELVAEGLRFYSIINFFARFFRTKTMQQSVLRDTLIKENYDEIRGLLPLLGHPEPGCFVFGHTHRAGIGKIPETNITVANAGCWTRQEDEGVPSLTWVEVEHDVKLFRLTDTGAELMYSESI
ncbi:MAG: metallophosphoesterase [Actinobacteria bacterium]|nr:metallophosphoesterase [Actinomycetota bacterium]